MMLDTQANVPASVAVVFPRADSSILGTDVYEVSVTLASLALTEYDGEFGRPDVSQIIHSTAVANYSGGGSPVNAAELLALAQQIATDFYLWRLALVEARYRSIVPWAADGMHDVEWTHSGGMTTAVHRSEWDPEFGKLKHAGTYGSSDVPAATGITHINNDATALQQIAVGDAGTDLNIATTAAAYDNAKTYSAGWVVLSSGSTYRFINATPSAGHSPPNATYWEDVTGQGLTAINVPRVKSINDDTNSSQYIVISNQGTDLSVGSTAPAYDSYKTYYKGQVVTSSGSTYRYNSDTPAYGVLITDPTWEDITGKGITVINIPQGSFTVLTGDFDYTASAGEVIVCDSVGGTAGNSKIRLPTDHIGKNGDEVVIKYVNWGAGTYLSVYGACDYDYGAIVAAPASPIWIFGDSDYVYGSCYPPPCSMILRWTHYHDGAPYERWVVAATDNLYRGDGLFPDQTFYSRPPSGNGTIAGLTFRRGFFAGGALSITKADVGLSNVDNTSDVNKPVSTAQQSAIDAGESYSAENKEGFTILAGMACSVHSSGTGIIKASSADNTKIAIGLIRADTANTFSGLVQKSGLFTLSDWTSVIGASTLAAKTTYFLDPSTPGKLTATVPTTTGQTVQIVGTAVSTTTLDLDIGVPILL